MLTQDELPRASLGRTAGEHGRQSAHDLSLLPIRGAAVLLVRAELFQRPARALQPLPELLGRQLTLRSLVGDASKLARLELYLIAQPAVVRRVPASQRDREAAEGQTGNEPEDRDRHEGHPIRPL